MKKLSAKKWIPFIVAFWIPANNLYSQSSAQNRSQQNLSLNYSPAGFAVGGIPTSGGDIGLHLGPNSILEAAYYQGDLDVLFYRVYTKFAALRLKYFFGNSFYVNVGGAGREVGVDWTPSSLTGNEADDAELFSVTSVGWMVSIGNRWSWRHFNIGCDWIGYFGPLSRVKQAKEDDTIVEKLNDEDVENRDKIKDDLDKLAKTPSSMLLIFYLGFSL